MLLDVLKTHRSPQELEHIAQAASEFLVEALAVFEMTQRGFTELLSTLRSDQHHARDLQAELEQQKALERATGVLMERHGLSADTAAERIRQTAARQGITVEEDRRQTPIAAPSAQRPAPIRTIPAGKWSQEDGRIRGPPIRTVTPDGATAAAQHHPTADGRIRGSWPRFERPAARAGTMGPPRRRGQAASLRSRLDGACPSVVAETSTAAASCRSSAATNGLLTVKRRAWVREKR